METELYKEYKERVVPALRERLGYKNLYQVPRGEKVVINTCISTQSSDAKQGLEDAKAELALITGQRPAETRSKKAFRTSSSERINQLGRRLHCGERICMSSYRDSLRCRYRASEIFGAFPRARLMVEETTLWECRISPSSLR